MECFGVKMKGGRRSFPANLVAMRSYIERVDDRPGRSRPRRSVRFTTPGHGFWRTDGGWLAPAPLLLVVLLWVCRSGLAQENAPVQATILAVSGRVEFSPAGSTTWYAATTNHALYGGDQLRTGDRSRATLRLRDQSVLPVGERSLLKLQGRQDTLLIQLLKGVLYFFHRDRPGRIELEGGGLNAAVRGTEVAFSVGDDGETALTVYDGEVEVTDDAGAVLRLGTGDVATGGPGNPLRRTAIVETGDWSAVQWALYYPAILAPEDLGWTAPPDEALRASWDRYRRGHLPAALAAYPAGRPPASDAERVYLGALLFSVGAIDEARRVFAEVTEGSSLAPVVAAHRDLAATVQRGGGDAGPPLDSTAGWLAESYRRQAQARLAEARDAARAATERAPESGFAWVRLAELEFSLGRVREATDALERGLEKSPENAAGHVLRGFLLAARHRVREAEAAFDNAVGLDGWLANGWLGRGLCRIRRGDLAGGRADLLVAAATEPQRAVLRSYLGKALAEGRPFEVAAREGQAARELDLAKRLDSGDPTAWLYSALLRQQENRVNEAIADLEESLVRNDNRAVYRSRLRLDEDRAVREANLANLFADAGLVAIGEREATRSVNADYANPGAHLFLANTYDARRDPRQIQLRYETPWFSEYLLANLLSPVGVGALSPTISHNEYSNFFERDRVGVANETTWTSNGDWLEEASLFGQFGNLAFALDGYYRSEVGQRANQDLEQMGLTATARAQAGPADGLFLQVIQYDGESGDVLRRYDPTRAIPGLRLEERHEPVVIGGWHHEWQPGVHTLFLASPWRTTQAYRNPANAVLTVLTDETGEINSASYSPVPLEHYRTEFTGVSLELQQLWELRSHTLIGGLRYQSGTFDTEAALDVAAYDPTAPALSFADPGLERWSFYAYDQWELRRGLLLTAGLVYDRLSQPVNFRIAPLTPGEDTLDQVSPKVGVTWSPWTGGTLRGAYTRSLGGVSYDQSFRLEPVQVAGFTQAYRGLFPESVVGSLAGQEMETAGLAWDQNFPSRTFVTLAGEWLSSEAHRDTGGFVYGTGPDAATAAFRQELDFLERSLSATVGQLVGRDLSLVLRYRLSEAELDAEYPGLPAGSPFFPEQRRRERSVLHELGLGARYQLPAGFFASWESRWTRQSNHEDAGGLAGDDFWQHDVWVGWRFGRRHAELAVGILNLTDQDYRLHPLNDFQETYRDRTVAVSGRFGF